MTTLADDLGSDDARTALKALQRKLASDMDLADPNVSAQIAGQLRQVIKDIAALGSSEEEGSVVDEIAKRRAARVAGPDATDGATEQGGKQRRGRSRSS